MKSALIDYYSIIVSFMMGDTLASFHTSGMIADFTEELKIPITVACRSKIVSEVSPEPIR